MIVKCKGCQGDTPEHDTLAGYCMLCADKRVKLYNKLKIENKAIKKRAESAERDWQLTRERVKELEEAVGEALAAVGEALALVRLELSGK